MKVFAAVLYLCLRSSTIGFFYPVYLFQQLENIQRWVPYSSGQNNRCKFLLWKKSKIQFWPWSYHSHVIQRGFLTGWISCDRGKLKTIVINYISHGPLTFLSIMWSLSPNVAFQFFSPGLQLSFEIWVISRQTYWPGNRGLHFSVSCFSICPNEI